MFTSSSSEISFKKMQKNWLFDFFSFFASRHNATTRWGIPAISLCLPDDFA